MFFFTDHITLIDVSKNLPFFFAAQTIPIKMLRVLFLRSESDLSALDLSVVYIFTADCNMADDS